MKGDKEKGCANVRKSTPHLTEDSTKKPQELRREKEEE